MALLSRLERLSMLEECNRKFSEHEFAGDTKHNNHLGQLIGLASRKVLKKKGNVELVFLRRE